MKSGDAWYMADEQVTHRRGVEWEENGTGQRRWGAQPMGETAGDAPCSFFPTPRVHRAQHQANCNRAEGFLEVRTSEASWWCAGRRAMAAGLATNDLGTRPHVNSLLGRRAPAWRYVIARGITLSCPDTFHSQYLLLPYRGTVLREAPCWSCPGKEGGRRRLELAVAQQT
jgi:hypothetical protein